MAIIDARGLEASNGEIFPTLPTANYEMEITGIEEKTTKPESKYPNHPMWMVVLTVCPGDEQEGQRLFYNSLLPTGDLPSDQFGRSVATLKNLCIAADLQVSSDQLDSADLMNQRLTAVVLREEYMDGGVAKTRNKVSALLPLS